MTIKRQRNFLNESAFFIKKNFGIRELIIISFFLHLIVISFPSDGRMVGDEGFYVPAARDILNGIPSNPEHPFLGKVWGAIGIVIFGDYWLGWRIPLVVFGILTLFVFYHFSKLFFDKQNALIATTFLSFDTIFFIHSSLLLIDVPPLFFAILGFYLYHKNHYFFTAISFGVAILCKEWSVLFLLVFFAYHLILSRHQFRVNKHVLIKASKFVVVLLIIIIVPLWAYIIIYQPYNPTAIRVVVQQQQDQYGNPLTVRQVTPEEPITNPFEHVLYILTYQSKIADSYKIQKNFWNHYAWGWIIPYTVEPSIYFETLEIVEKQTTQDTEVITIAEKKHPISWKGIGNFPIWLSIWIILPFVSYRIITKRAKNLDYLITCWIVFTFFSWFYVSGIMGRIVFAFYFINVVPILAIGIPHFIENIFKARSNLKNIITIIWLGAAIIFFLNYFPVDFSLI